MDNIQQSRIILRLQLECTYCSSRCVRTITRVTPITKGSTISVYCGNPFCRISRKQLVLKNILKT